MKEPGRLPIMAASAASAPFAGDASARTRRLFYHPPDDPHSTQRTTSGAAGNCTKSTPRAIEITPVNATQTAETRRRFRRDACESNELPAPARIISGAVPAPKRHM